MLSGRPNGAENSSACAEPATDADADAEPTVEPKPNADAEPSVALLAAAHADAHSARAHSSSLAAAVERRDKCVGDDQRVDLEVAKVQCDVALVQRANE